MAIEVNVPDIGDFKDVPIISILVNVGDSIAVEDPLIELESDKATMEVPSSLAGVVRELKVAVGDTLNVTIPALDTTVEAKVTLINVQGDFASWRATRATGDFDLRSFELRATPVQPVPGLRPGMSALLAHGL